ncbi:3'(2'),5'-bisphosphate nucleotidase CysQ [Roseomonas rosulenta]|uniref:3'(2'),5'-bisphosphate nucleotidase CysQ n=1 Tax=Roseomonas rosulenta TaxID=2748667 RepID=UPI001E64329D|nr:3'(2'),5'-bisphosphate nucleotidase CysQ [Roseomonas rosulenta]
MMTDTPLRSRLAECFAVIAQEAGARIMAFYGAAQVQAKDDGSPLTQADLAAHDVILAGLAAACPELPVVSEEDAARAGRAPEGPFILVDPLDGTREFISGNGEFTVNIALVDGGVPVAGVVHAPALGRLWIGALGAGAEATGPDGAARRPIAVRAPAAAGLVAVASRSHRDAQTEAFLAGLPISGLRSVGSSLKFCLVAEGEADVYPRFGPTMEWDTAAGQAVLEAAGGRVVCPDGAPFRYGKAGADWRNGGFIAWGSEA